VNASVAVVLGSAFGANGEGFVRVSIATAIDLQLDGLSRLVAEYQSAAAVSDQVMGQYR
jgi:bifunctional pyridoxal-dependent enzyme with beta-cystathionase and maltose regulon repressor activities